MEQIFRRVSVRARILANPLGSILRQFIDYLLARGHKPGPVHQYVFAAEHFGNWLGCGPIDRKSVGSFLSTHLPNCRCEKPASRTRQTLRAALNRLLEMRGVPRPSPVVQPYVARLLREYETHLRDTCGLAGSTAKYRVRYARELLQHFDVRRVRQLRAWRPIDVSEYVAMIGRDLKPGSGQVLASSVRAFTRFLLLHDIIRRDLAAAVPSFAHWRLAALPAVVEREHLETLLAAVDATTSVGRRDRAVLLAMVDLGLRAADVAALTVEGVDLVSGVLRIEHPKERRGSEVPMTERFADALRGYLRGGRPSGGSHRLFVLHRAPLGQALKPNGIRSIVLRYAARTGLARQIRGTHVIRHSVASSLINAGASIKHIADLLGHRSIDTTAIYAKVDMRSLSSVAMPWPGVRA